MSRDDVDDAGVLKMVDDVGSVAIIDKELVSALVLKVVVVLKLDANLNVVDGFAVKEEAAETDTSGVGMGVGVGIVMFVGMFKRNMFARPVETDAAAVCEPGIAGCTVLMFVDSNMYETIGGNFVKVATTGSVNCAAMVLVWFNGLDDSAIVEMVERVPLLRPVGSTVGALVSLAAAASEC